MKNKSIVIISVVIIAVILIGEMFIYSFNPNSVYSADMSMNEEGLSYSISSDISEKYDIVLTDNDGFKPVNEYYLYRDTSYKTTLNEDNVDYYIEQLRYLTQRNGITFTVLNSSELNNRLSDDIGTECSGKALICITGDLPDTVYTGSGTDVIFTWLKNGGSLYWAGNTVGSYYSTAESTICVSDSQMLFLGCSCSNINDVTNAHNRISDNGFCDALCLQNNDIRYGLNINLINDRKTLAIGYTENGYSTISLVEYGQGMVCVFGGNLTTLQRTDMGAVLASKICFQSTLVDHQHGELCRQSISGTVRFDTNEDYYVAYAYIGEYFIEYSKTVCFYNQTKI